MKITQKWKKSFAIHLSLITFANLSVKMQNHNRPSSPMFSPRNAQPRSLSPNQVSRIIGIPVKQGETIKGKSRITYMPYERKVIQYQERQYIERVPIKRKVIQYQQRKVVEEVPREVVKTDYYAVESIKQYYKEVVPEKKIEYIPIEKKVKKIQYVPVEKQIVHYPESQTHEYAKGQSRIVLGNQGVTVRPDAQYRPIDPTLIYKYSNVHSTQPIGYVEDGYIRNLSTAPSVPSQINTGGFNFGGHSESVYSSHVYSPRGGNVYTSRQDLGDGGQGNVYYNS